MWNGFGDNARVLKWVCDRIEGKGKAKETAIGFLPTPDAIDMTGYVDKNRDEACMKATMEALLSVDAEGWKKEIATVAESYEKFGSRMPFALKAKLAEIEKALDAAK